jgi:dTDP-4-amino-4,6-dideoxygalactose transaminase
VATAVAASACGYTPFLADIDAEDWVLDPGRIAALPAIRQAAAVIAVAPFGHMPPLPPWEDFSRSTGLPVVVDAAACFDSLDPQSLKRSSLTLVLSLHATKTFSTAEGGLVFCPDGATAERVSRALNFGFFNNRESTGPSINGKLSEYHAAIGLAGMESWQAKRQGFVSAARSYAAQARRHGLEASIIADCRHANPYAVYAAADEPDARRVAAALDGEAIGHRLWYGLGLHHQPEYRAAPREPLPWTERLAPRLVGLPMSCDLAEADVIRVVRAIAAAKEAGFRPPG